MTFEIKKQLNPYLSNLIVEFIKLHDLHWNVKGKMFPQVHEYTDQLYERMSSMYDEVAEKIIMQGEKPASKIEDYMKLATIKEEDCDDFTDVQVITIVLEDLKLLRDQAVSIHKNFDEEKNFSVTTMLEDHIIAFEKDIWFLESMIGK